MKLIKFNFLIICLFVIIPKMAAQNRIINQITLFPQEKLYLHTDRTMYVPGERIWFKAYVVDAFSHQMPTLSQYAYIELIDSSDSLLYRVMVKKDEFGLFYGHIFLSEIVPEGSYTLRAYTRFMENLGDDYFFKKPVWIGNLKSVKEQTKSRPAADYEVSFFPEGGYLVAGAPCRVAFKALNEQGASIPVTGVLEDREGNRLGEVSTLFAGMGSFNFIPEEAVTYFLKCKDANNREKRFVLPAAKKTFSLSLSFEDNNHLVTLNKSPDLQEKTLNLFIHCKGKALYLKEWNHRAAYLKITTEQLPSGVIQVLLLDEQMNPVSERLIFNKNEDQAALVFSTDKPIYQSRERVLSEIQVTDSEGNPLAGHVSVAVTDDKDMAIDTLHTITAQLLLSSELKGYIESPGYYLLDNPSAAEALDHLMMTHGWRRYDITEALKGNYTLPGSGYEQSKDITGAVRSAGQGNALANSEVTLYSNSLLKGAVLTNTEGIFNFSVDYPDSVRFLLRAKNPKGKPDVELVLIQETFPALKHIPENQSLLSDGASEAASLTSEFLKKAAQRAMYDEDIKVLQLDEITVSTRSIAKKDEVRLSTFWANASSDLTIYRESFENKNVSSVASLLQGVSSVQVNSDGSISIRGNAEPALIYIDGMELLWSSVLEMVHVDEIECIDIFKTGRAAVLGINSARGAISITTRRGDMPSGISKKGSNYISFSPLGFQRPVEFYAPRYDAPASGNRTVPDYRTTIFWQPNIIFLDDGKASFEFYTSDFPTTYSVVIEGLSNDGKIIRQTASICVIQK